MFGMGGFGRSAPVRKPVRPLFDKQELPEESSSPFMLVSIEDIYRAINRLKTGRMGEPVLLLKKGIEVEATQLPRLMKNGANPSQFRIKSADGTVSEEVTADSFAGLPVTNPIFEAPASLVRTLRSRKRAIMLDSDQKSLRRLTDCLFMCGFQLDNLHPVRLSSNLNWALQKYMPHVLVVDYHLSGKQNGIQVLHMLQPALPSLEQVILTTPPLQTLPGWEARRIETFCENGNVYLLPKPVNRFALKQILDEAIQNTDSLI